MKFSLSSFFKKEYLVLYLIVSVGAFLRLQGVFTNSFAYTYDVGRDMLALWNIVYNHDLMFIGATTGIQGVFYGPWWYYMLVPFFIIFRGDPQGIALTMSVVGILSIVLAYYLGNKIGNKFMALAFASLVSVSPVLISLSSQVWNPNIAPLFVLFTLFLLYKIYFLGNKKTDKYFFLLGIMLAINIDIEILWGILFTISVIFSLATLYFKKIKIKQIIYLIAGGMIVASPRIAFELKHNFLMTKSLIAFLLSKNSTEDPLTFVQILENRIFTFIDQFSASLTFNNQLVAWIVIVLTLGILILFYKNASDIIKKFIITLLTVVFVFFIGTVIFSRALWPHYLVGLPVIYIFLFVISLYLLFKKLNNFILAGFVVMLFFILNLNIEDKLKTFSNPNWEGDASVYRNHLAVVDYVYRQAKGKDFKYVVYTPPVHDYTYRYLFKWYGPKKYGYQPLEKSDTAYFILEPDFQYTSRLTDWLRQREADGKVIKSETVKGGIIVQTRVN